MRSGSLTCMFLGCSFHTFPHLFQHSPLSHCPQDRPHTVHTRPRCRKNTRSCTHPRRKTDNTCTRHGLRWSTSLSDIAHTPSKSSRPAAPNSFRHRSLCTCSPLTRPQTCPPRTVHSLTHPPAPSTCLPRTSGTCSPPSPPALPASCPLHMLGTPRLQQASCSNRPHTPSMSRRSRPSTLRCTCMLWRTRFQFPRSNWTDRPSIRSHPDWSTIPLHSYRNQHSPPAPRTCLPRTCHKDRARWLACACRASTPSNHR